MGQSYRRRNVGDIVNGAVLVERVNGQKWKMQCSCGNLFIAQPSCSSGMCPSCGQEAGRIKRIKHGEAPMKGKKATRLYMIWDCMKSRCNNSRDTGYKNYGGRGIRVCREWGDYLIFKKWALENGYDEKLTLDRIDVNGDYTPANCRWVNEKVQGRNRRNNHLVTYKGETKTLVEWAEILGMNYHTLKHRINSYGYTVEEAFKVPIGSRRKNMEDVPNDDRRDQ